MIDHVSIGVSDITRSKAFYDAVLAPLGYTCQSAGDTYLGYGTPEHTQLWLLASRQPVPADPNSGLHFCLCAPNRASVAAFHAAALAQGGQDNGKPGLRADYGNNYYAAFIIDPDGYRMEAYCNKAG
jgi:catechol 2,3-dioxygenase-like lactoylglutathione lyase family enzyme